MADAWFAYARFGPPPPPMMMKRGLMLVMVIILVAPMCGFGEERIIESGEQRIIQATALKALEEERMGIAVELQITRIEIQGYIDEMKILQDKIQKIQPKAIELQKEFMDLTDQINKMRGGG